MEGATVVERNGSIMDGSSAELHGYKRGSVAFAAAISARRGMSRSLRLARLLEGLRAVKDANFGAGQSVHNAIWRKNRLRCAHKL